MGLESTKHELQNNLRINRFQITLIAATTIATILISLYCLFSGLFIVFQNLFYVPIILSCMYYTMRGFIYSVCLAVLYLLLILVFTSQSSIIMQALVRVFIFIIVAGVVTFLSARNKQDITERKRAEELLRQQKEEQQVIFDAVPAMIFFKDTENRFIRVNRALAQASGMTVEQMEGKSCFELFPDLADKYWKDDSEVIAAGVPKRDIIESMATPNGVAWVKTDKIPYWDEKGKIAGVICFSIDITALINTENALRKHFLFLETLIDTIPNPIFYKNIKGEYTGCNDAFAAYMGILKEEILGKTVYDLSPNELADVYKKTDQELFDHPGVQVYEAQIRYANGTLHDVVFNKATFTDEYGNVSGLVGVILDVTDRKQAERRQRLTAEILGILNDSSALTDAIKRILIVIKRETGFEAIGIRLRSGDDFPYFVQEGFSDDFLLVENTLTVRDLDGGVCRDENGNYSLECTCGLVISGKTDPANPLFTTGGSCWTNNSFPLLDVPVDQDPRLHPRNRCIHEGFLSVALIPIRADREIVGLLQLNDRKKDCFTLDMIHFFEGLSASIGLALMRRQLEDERERLIAELRKALSKVKLLSGLLPICSSCKKIRNDKGYWEQMETYISEHSAADFSHGICPECAKKLYPEYYKKK